MISYDMDRGRRSPAIYLAGLSKRFYLRGIMPGRPSGSVDALLNVNLSVRSGSIHGLIGPNGSGKSTLLRILATIVLPTSGHAWVRGVDVVASPLAARKAVGFSTGEERSLYWRLTGRQNLEFYAALYHLHEPAARIGEVFERLGLSRDADRPVSSYSQGMARRLSLARAMLHRPPILLLDEPVRSLDPLGAQLFHELLREAREHGGTTILLATHDLFEAANVCDTVSVLARGRITNELTSADPAELTKALTRAAG
jgi:ABC-2 type transport system ATP-binding protein